MMLDPARATETITQSVQSNEHTPRPEETFILERRARRFDETLFFVYHSDVPAMREGGSLTPTAAEMRERNHYRAVLDVIAPTNDLTERARDARLTLLAKKYEGVSTTEDDARLMILTQRLRKLSPRVTSGDVEKLTTMVGQLEQVSSNLEEVRRKLGLR